MLDFPRLAHQRLLWCLNLTHFKINQDDGLVWSDQDILASDVSMTDASGVDLVERIDDVSSDLGGVFYLV